MKRLYITHPISAVGAVRYRVATEHLPSHQVFDDPVLTENGVWLRQFRPIRPLSTAVHHHTNNIRGLT